MDISVVVCTYNPKWEELKLTLRSILLQKSVSYEIVITDDGSSVFMGSEVESYLDSMGFSDYKIVQNSENMGTVMNIISGIEASSGRFIKLISPGDCLYGESSLRYLLNCAEKNGTGFAFGDVINFDSIADHFTPIRWQSWPQDAKIYTDNNLKIIKRNQLLLSDNIHGVSTIVSRELFIKYLGMIRGKVRYCEDLVYRLMVNDGIAISYCNEKVVLYSFGDGISTSQDDKWNRLIKQDWDAVNLMVIESGKNSRGFIRKFKLLKDVRFQNNKLKKTIPYLLASPYLFAVKISRMIFRRLTDTDVDRSYIDMLFDVG